MKKMLKEPKPKFNVEFVFDTEPETEEKLV